MCLQDQRLALPSDSYLVNYFDNLDAYLDVGPPVYFVSKDVDVTQRLGQQSTQDIRRAAGCVRNDQRHRAIRIVVGPRWRQRECQHCKADDEMSHNASPRLLVH